MRKTILKSRRDDRVLTYTITTDRQPPDSYQGIASAMPNPCLDRRPFRGWSVITRPYGLADSDASSQESMVDCLLRKQRRVLSQTPRADPRWAKVRGAGAIQKFGDSPGTPPCSTPRTTPAPGRSRLHGSRPNAAGKQPLLRPRKTKA